jgi:hypothetical protein
MNNHILSNCTANNKNTGKLNRDRLQVGRPGFEFLQQGRRFSLSQSLNRPWGLPSSLCNPYWSKMRGARSWNLPVSIEEEFHDHIRTLYRLIRSTAIDLLR